MHQAVCWVNVVQCCCQRAQSLGPLLMLPPSTAMLPSPARLPCAAPQAHRLLHTYYVPQGAQRIDFRKFLQEERAREPGEPAGKEAEVRGTVGEGLCGGRPCGSTCEGQAHLAWSAA